MLLKPTIALERLVVTKQGRSVVDVRFHLGVNIIRGENSAGKTTIVRFIAHALGAENIGFNQMALLCDETYLEMQGSGTTVTLRRSISASSQQPMSIYWGALDQALAAPAAAGWQLFPFRRSESRESFSQILFRLLEMPELRGESGSNITMHQLFRLIYSDQETPSAELFRSEKFDAAITRAAIGDYLLGIDGNELYELRLRENAVEKQLAGVKNSIRTIYDTFGSSGTEISLEFLNERLLSLGSELTQLRTALDGIDNQEAAQPSASGEDNRLRTSLDEALSQLSTSKRRHVELESEIADSELFLAELAERLQSLDESAVAEAYLGTAVFSFCPSCFSTVDASQQKKDVCGLCKSPINPDSAKSQLARMRNELSLQLRESNQIRESRVAELAAIVREMPAFEARLATLESDFRRNNAKWRPTLQIAIQNLSREIGGKEQEIKNTLELKKLAELLDRNNQKAGELEAELAWVRGRMEAVQREQKGRREIAYLSVASNLGSLLREDLDRQEEFSKANDINFDFGANRVSVDGHYEFSASSMVYLRHSFHLALLLASIEQSFFRFPRFVILDGIEDGGMEPDRSFNFQKLILRKSESIAAPHQILFATSQICPELDIAEYVVGPSLTHERKSIQF